MPPLPPLSLTGGAGGSAGAYGGTAEGYSPFTDGALNVSYGSSLGGVGASVPPWVWIAAAAVALAVLARGKKL